MTPLNPIAIGGAALAAFAASSVWYLVLGKELAKVSPAFASQKPAAWKMLAVIAQSLVLASVVAWLLRLIGDLGWLRSAGVGVLLWIGLPAVQWAGSMLWEKVPLRMAAIHAGDWLVKLVLVCAIVGAWP